MITLSDTIPDMEDLSNLADLADRLKWAREKKGWTQDQLADAAGVSQSTIGNLESRLRQSARKLAMIAKVAGVNAYWLETGEGSPFETTPDDLLKQVAALTLAERSVVAAVVASFRGVSVDAKPNMGQGLSEYEARLLDLLRKMNDRAREDAEDQLREILREQQEHAFRESESTAEREQREQTVASKTHHLGAVEKPRDRERKS